MDGWGMIAALSRHIVTIIVTVGSFSSPAAPTPSQFRWVLLGGLYMVQADIRTYVHPRRNISLDAVISALPASGLGFRESGGGIEILGQGLHGDGGCQRKGRNDQDTSPTCRERKSPARRTAHQYRTQNRWSNYISIEQLPFIITLNRGSTNKRKVASKH